MDAQKIEEDNSKGRHKVEPCTHFTWTDDGIIYNDTMMDEDRLWIHKHV